MRRRHGGNDSRRYYDWIDRAQEDLQTTEVLLLADKCYFSCAFHCQQAIEKALKAYLLVKSGDLVDGHNLTWLCKQAMRHERDFDQWLDESAALNRCYVETRYPTDIPYNLSHKRVRRFYQMAKDMFEFIDDAVDRELERREAGRA